MYLVEVSSVDQLVERLKKGKFRTLEEVKTLSKYVGIWFATAYWHYAQIVNAKAGGDDDDEIIAGKQKMSLKCPVG